MEETVARQNVIIAHPNEMKTITLVQRKICTRMTNNAGSPSGSICTPQYPLFIPLSVQECVQTILSCTLFAPEICGSQIRIPAQVCGTQETVCTETLIIGELRNNDSPTVNFRDIPEINCFPLELPVFRIAEIETRTSDTTVQWTVVSSRWIKGKKNAAESAST